MAEKGSGEGVAECGTCGRGGREVEMELEVEWGDEDTEVIVREDEVGAGERSREKRGRGAGGVKSKRFSDKDTDRCRSRETLGQHRRDVISLESVQDTGRKKGRVDGMGLKDEGMGRLLSALLDPLAFLLETASSPGQSRGGHGCGGLVLKEDGE